MADDPEAFPCVGYGPSGDAYMQPGMTLRDWFAGQVLPAIVSATSAGQHQPGPVGDDRPLIERMAHDAYALADAMLAERSKP